MLNVPPEYTNKELAEKVMSQYGALHNVYESSKQIEGILFKTGNRLFQFLRVDKITPKHMEIDGIKIRLVYSMPPAWVCSEELVNDESIWGTCPKTN